MCYVYSDGLDNGNLYRLYDFSSGSVNVLSSTYFTLFYIHGFLLVFNSTCSMRLKSIFLLLWAHGLHLLFFPVWPVYSIDVCLDRLPSIPQNLCIFGDF